MSNTVDHVAAIHPLDVGSGPAALPAQPSYRSGCHAIE
jgi:hypothetical protein